MADAAAVDAAAAGSAADAACPAVVYLLRNERGRTYVGCAVDAARRLRQHNGELAGGAAQTARGRPWRHVLVVEGFGTRRHALQFEYAWRRVHRRRRCAYTVAGRRASLAHLMALPRWSRNAPPAAEVRLVVREA
jgi:predicted GIY-YIG superfamily endonuclease